MLVLKKRIAAIMTVVSLLGCVCLSACDTKDTKGTKVVLNEVAHSVFYAPLYVALEQGYFEEAGLDITLVTGFGADKTMTALLTGEADIGLMGCESTIYAYAEGAKDYPVSFAQLTQRAGNFLVAREPMPDFDWTMLRGKKVLGGRPGGMPEMVFEFILEKNGMNPETDLEIDKSIDFGSTAAAFSGGAGDFTVEFEPHATLLEEEGKGYVVASLGMDSGYVPYTSFCATKSYLADNTETIKAFVAAMERGMEEVYEKEPMEIAKIIAPCFEGTSAEVLEKIVKRYKEQDSWKRSMLFERDAFSMLCNILMDNKLIEEPAVYEDLVSTEYTD